MDSFSVYSHLIAIGDSEWCCYMSLEIHANKIVVLPAYVLTFVKADRRRKPNSCYWMAAEIFFPHRTQNKSLYANSCIDFCSVRPVGQPYNRAKLQWPSPKSGKYLKKDCWNIVDYRLISLKTNKNHHYRQNQSIFDIILTFIQ